ncbi:Rrp15p-domain-containing protein [Powellomyces hirtus]|nr:Rrp15p-domain-containing protein [Powellomyces hirtus]
MLVEFRRGTARRGALTERNRHPLGRVSTGHNTVLQLGQAALETSSSDVSSAPSGDKVGGKGEEPLRVRGVLSEVHAHPLHDRPCESPLPRVGPGRQDPLRAVLAVGDDLARRTNGAGRDWSERRAEMRNAPPPGGRAHVCNEATLLGINVGVQLSGHVVLAHVRVGSGPIPGDGGGSGGDGRDEPGGDVLGVLPGLPGRDGAAARDLLAVPGKQQCDALPIGNRRQQRSANPRADSRAARGRRDVTHRMVGRRFGTRHIVGDEDEESGEEEDGEEAADGQAAGDATQRRKTKATGERTRVQERGPKGDKESDGTKKRKDGTAGWALGKQRGDGANGNSSHDETTRCGGQTDLTGDAGISQAAASWTGVGDPSDPRGSRHMRRRERIPTGRPTLQLHGTPTTPANTTPTTRGPPAPPEALRGPAAHGPSSSDIPAGTAAVAGSSNESEAEGLENLEGDEDEDNEAGDEFDMDAMDDDSGAQKEEAELEGDVAASAGPRETQESKLAGAIGENLSGELGGKDHPYRPILAKQRHLDNEKLEEEARRVITAEKKKKAEVGHTVPDHTITDYERKLREKVSTRGVVQLFNAIRVAQKTAEIVKSDGIWESRDAAPVISKNSFLDTLNPKSATEGATKTGPAEKTSTKPAESTDSGPSWAKEDDMMKAPNH